MCAGSTQGRMHTCADGVIVDVGNTDGALIKLFPTAQSRVPPLPAAEERHPVGLTGGLHMLAGVG